jgi:L-iditol 2-dehydrogenase
VYQVITSLSAEGNAQAIRSLFGSTEYEAPQTVFECTSAESSVVTASFTVRKGGDVVVIGVGRKIMNNLPFAHISLSEIRASTFRRSLPENEQLYTY